MFISSPFCKIFAEHWNGSFDLLLTSGGGVVRRMHGLLVRGGEWPSAATVTSTAAAFPSCGCSGAPGHRVCSLRRGAAPYRRPHSTGAMRAAAAPLSHRRAPATARAPPDASQSSHHCPRRLRRAASLLRQSRQLKLYCTFPTLST